MYVCMFHDDLIYYYLGCVGVHLHRSVGKLVVEMELQNVDSNSVQLLPKESVQRQVGRQEQEDESDDK